MTKEQYDLLSTYEDLLYTASQRNYVMFGSYEKKRKLSELYTDVFNKKSNMMNSCSSCALQAMKELAVEYYNFTDTTTVQDEVQEPKITKTKKTRKK